jgi:hypothetical protein
LLAMMLVRLLAMLWGIAVGEALAILAKLW